MLTQRQPCSCHFWPTSSCQHAIPTESDPRHFPFQHHGSGFSGCLHSTRYIRSSCLCITRNTKQEWLLLADVSTRLPTLTRHNGPSCHSLRLPRTLPQCRTNARELHCRRCLNPNERLRLGHEGHLARSHRHGGWLQVVPAGPVDSCQLATAHIRDYGCHVLGTYVWYLTTCARTADQGEHRLLEHHQLASGGFNFSPLFI